MYYAALALWAAFVIGAVFYTRGVMHPHMRPLPAYLIFVGVFTVISFLLFTAGSMLLHLAGWDGTLTDPFAAALFLLVVFTPAFLAARWQLRKPPRSPGRL